MYIRVLKAQGNCDTGASAITKDRISDSLAVGVLHRPSPLADPFGIALHLLFPRGRNEKKLRRGGGGEGGSTSGTWDCVRRKFILLLLLSSHVRAHQYSSLMR